MQKIKYRLSTLSPVLITVNIGDVNTVNTNNFINGRSLLGVFANNYIKKTKAGRDVHLDEKFYRWFLKGDLRFSNAYPVDKNTPCFPVPISIQKEKNGKEIFDLLFEEPENKQTEAIPGFGFWENSILSTCKVKKSLNFHHKRDREKGSSEKGQIFNYESIDGGQVFEGNISGPEELLRDFTGFFGKKFIAYTGRSRKTQYGKIEMEFISAIEPYEAGTGDIKTDNETVSMTLLSDLILYNDYGFSTTDVDILEKCTGFKIEKSFIRTGTISNYISVWHLRKPSDLCFLAGSTFLVKASQNDRDKLLKLQEEGIGERKNEGFGRVIFNWQKKARLTGKDEQKEQNTKELSRPAGAIPEIAKEIVKKSIKDLIEREIKILAIKDADRFRKLPTKSLIGRLEAMIKKSKTIERDKFISNLELLRKSAKDKLCRCRNDKKTLYDFIKDYKVNIDMIGKDKIKEFGKEVNFYPEHDSEFLAELYRIYFTTFFAIMRKRVNKEKGEG